MVKCHGSSLSFEVFGMVVMIEFCISELFMVCVCVAEGFAIYDLCEGCCSVENCLKRA